MHNIAQTIAQNAFQIRKNIRIDESNYEESIWKFLDVYTHLGNLL